MAPNCVNSRQVCIWVTVAHFYGLNSRRFSHKTADSCVTRMSDWVNIQLWKEFRRCYVMLRGFWRVIECLTLLDFGDHYWIVTKQGFLLTHNSVVNQVQNTQTKQSQCWIKICTSWIVEVHSHFTLCTNCLCQWRPQ